MYLSTLLKTSYKAVCFNKFQFKSTLTA